MSHHRNWQNKREGYLNRKYHEISIEVNPTKSLTYLFSSSNGNLYVNYCISPSMLIEKKKKTNTNIFKSVLINKN